jgi:AAA domain
MKLNNLKLTAFRGATKPLTLEFDPTKNITMIFGENGNGKSTISDGIVCLCTNDHGSLDDKSSIDKSFYTSIPCKPEDVVISLNTDTGTFTAKMSKSGAFVKTPDIGHPIIRHLRRSQITQLIEEQPAKRYEKLASYIDVNNIAKSEDSLRKAKKDADDELRIAIATLQSASATLEQTWKTEGSPLKSWEEWAKNESTKNVSTETTKYGLLQTVISNWVPIKDLKLRYENDTLKLLEAEKAVDAAEKKLKEAQEKNENANADLLNLLQSAKKFISEKSQITTCPVCDQGIEKDKIVKSLAEKIDSMEVVKAISAEVRAARTDLTGKQKVIESTRNTFYQKIKALENSAQSITEEPYVGIASKLSFLSEAKPENEKINTFLTLYGELDLKIESQKKIAEKIKTAIDQFNLIKKQYDSIIAARIKSSNTDKLCKAMDEAIKIVEKRRKDFIQNELTSISNEVNNLYQKIHPREGLGGISLTLKKSAKNSLELNADFHTKTAITPQSVYSESHLDTLGICVFIALAKKYGSESTILILDDVVMSVDENHLDRFIDLLHDECGDFAHILITTHYRPWRDRYRYNRAPGSKVHFVELRTWSLEGGIKIQNGKIALDELRLSISDTKYFDRQKITSTSGIILENILDYLSLLYGCKLQRKPKNDYQLRELLDSISKKLISSLRVQHFEKDKNTGKYVDTTIIKEADLKEVLDKIKDLAIIRNWVGAHFNYDGSMVSDTDVENFGKFTVELAELLTCPESGQFPDRDKSGSYWETKTGSIRLHPLKEPK